MFYAPNFPHPRTYILDILVNTNIVISNSLRPMSNYLILSKIIIFRTQKNNGSKTSFSKKMSSGSLKKIVTKCCLLTIDFGKNWWHKLLISKYISMICYYLFFFLNKQRRFWYCRICILCPPTVTRYLFHYHIRKSTVHHSTKVSQREIDAMEPEPLSDIKFTHFVEKINNLSEYPKISQSFESTH